MNLSKTTLFALPCVVLAFAPVTLTAQVPQTNLLRLTEYSSTLLKASVNGGPETIVPNLASDQWRYDTGILNQSVATFFSLSWAEADSPGKSNIVHSELQDGHLFMNISSDANFLSVGLDGETFGIAYTDPNEGLLLLGVQFFDKGDASGVPDTSSTLVLMSLAASVMFGMARFRKVRT